MGCREFLHYQNNEGAIESICPDCQEIIFAEKPVDLEPRETNHMCDPETIKMVWARHTQVDS